MVCGTRNEALNHPRDILENLPLQNSISQCNIKYGIRLSDKPTCFCFYNCNYCMHVCIFMDALLYRLCLLVPLYLVCVYCYGCTPVQAIPSSATLSSMYVLLWMHPCTGYTFPVPLYLVCVYCYGCTPVQAMPVGATLSSTCVLLWIHPCIGYAFRSHPI